MLQKTAGASIAFTGKHKELSSIDHIYIHIFFRVYKT